jgi:transcriptional accessory protein Tex/SPT6
MDDESVASGTGPEIRNGDQGSQSGSPAKSETSSDDGSRRDEERRKVEARQEAVRKILEQHDKHQILSEYYNEICEAELSFASIKQLAKLANLWFVYKAARRAADGSNGNFYPGFWSEFKIWFVDGEVAKMKSNPQEERERRKKMRTKALREKLIKEFEKNFPFRQFIQDFGWKLKFG